MKMTVPFDIQTKVPTREKCIYTPCYCEENVWHLCQLLTRKESEFKCYCVFMSNSSRAVHLWKQRSCSGESDQPVIWDYHVFAVYGNKKLGYCVLDFDTTLKFPVPFKEYASKAIRSEENIFKRYFRVIPAEDFLKHFSSDRRHMRIGDSWSKPPPKYPPLISNEGNPHNLDDFISMDKGKGYGDVIDCTQFIQRFTV